MRRILSIVLLLSLLMPAGLAEGWVVVEDDDVFPDRIAQAQVLMRNMTLEQKIWQLLIVTPEALTGEKITSTLGKTNVLADRPVGGVVIFGQNIVSEKQLKTLISKLQSQSAAAGGQPLLIAVSEEGGAYSRVANKLGYPLQMSAPEVGIRRDATNAYATGQSIGAYLKPFGINLDFAPVSDVVTADDSWIQERTYGADPARTAEMTVQMAAGLRSEGIVPCFSHFPGQGSINGNLNNREVVNARPLAEMRGADWVPFRQAIAAQAEMIMVSHAPSKAAGDGLPASLSPIVITQWLREELGFTGVVITDSLRMGAITSAYKPGQAAVRALQAGADLLLLPTDADAAVNSILKAIDAGELTVERIDESTARVLALKIERNIIQ
ncbi:MAG: glycoside hydrolase family 3 protein [Clostridia bacterium]|nr:glycoside hydrolase family 3 protein [Clostridia bacterium]